jgi:hypothetical protein
VNKTKAGSISAEQTNFTATSELRKGYSFYRKLWFLYFLNLIDWICTEALISSGHFYEANPIMQPVLKDFSSTLIIKGVLPFVMIIICSIIYKLAGEEDSLWMNLLIYFGIGVYALVNLWHILNFVLLFFHF